MKRLAVLAMMICLLELPHGASGEIDVFMRAVGFALTGTDDAEPVIINRGDCVFKIDHDLFRLNNVQTDRVKIQSWEQKTIFGLKKWVTVSLHGDNVTFETTAEGMKDDGSDVVKQLKEQTPSLFKPQHSVFKEHELRLETDDQDRVTRAWSYIFSHGCVGKTSPF